MKLLVRNLDRKINLEQLHKLFEEFGTVQSCNIVIDKASGLSKGFAFVEMPNDNLTKDYDMILLSTSLPSEMVKKTIQKYKNSIIIFGGRHPWYLSNYLFDNKRRSK